MDFRFTEEQLLIQDVARRIAQEKIAPSAEHFDKTGEFPLDNIRLLMEVVGQNAYVKRGSSESVLMSRLEASYRSLVILTFGGGVNEVQRDLITVFGLGMPMVKR